jgi:hypothetical protein
MNQKEFHSKLPWKYIQSYYGKVEDRMEVLHQIFDAQDKCVISVVTRPNDMDHFSTIANFSLIVQCVNEKHV